MKCPECKKEIRNDSKFCCYCGLKIIKKVDESINKISLRCENCDGALVVDSDKSVLTCPYCGHKTLIIENDEVISVYTEDGKYASRA